MTLASVKSSLSGSLGRETLLWGGLFVVLLTSSFLAYQPVSGFIDPAVLVFATGVAFIIVVAQAIQNGNVAFSWPITSAPAIAFAIHRYRTVALGNASLFDLQDVFLTLTAVLFCGTTAHLLGVTAVETKRDEDQRMSKTKRRVLLMILILTGIAFGYFFVAPTFR